MFNQNIELIGFAFLRQKFFDQNKNNFLTILL